MNLQSKLSLLQETLFEGGSRRFLNLCGSYFTMKMEPEKVTTTPIYLQLETTTKCNIRCEFCYGTFKRRPVKNLSLADFKKIIGQFPGLVKVHLQGIGEPFLNKEIFEMIKYAKSQGIKVDLTTNGTLLDIDTTKKILASGLDYMEFSVDSADPETFEKIRAGANFGQVVGNIKRFLIEKGSATGPQAKVTAVLTDDHIEEAPDIVEFTYQLGISSLFLIRVQDFDSEAVKQDNDNDGEFDKQFSESVRKAKIVAKKRNVHLDVSMPLNGSLERGCKRPWLSTSILADGYVVPCCRVIRPEEINFGNVLDSDFRADIWNSSDYKEFRKALKGKNPPETCNNCHFYYRNPMSRDHI